MNYRFCFLFAAVLFSANAHAQVLPKPGAKLNYTQVMLEYPKLAAASQYIVQIAEDTAGSTFNKPLIEQKDSSTATLISGLQFGKKYKWHYGVYQKGTGMVWQGPYTFEIAADSFTRQLHYSVRVLQNNASNLQGCISADCLRQFINRSGQPVWNLPTSSSTVNYFTSVRDLRLTSAGTVTYITDQNLFVQAYETDLQGNILWQAPNNGIVSGDSTEYYHHDFKRLPNGNYMVLSKKFVWKPVPTRYAAGLGAARFDTYVSNDTQYARIEFGTIIEYNPKKQVVWAWNSEDYLTSNDIFNIPEEVDSASLKKNTNIPPQLRAKRGKSEAHMNAFSVDGKDEFVYAGFRNLSRVIKIDKKTLEVVHSWGTKTSPEAEDNTKFFNRQHDANILPNGNIAVFNNNDANAPDKTPSLVVFTQPKNGSGSRVVYNYPCWFDSDSPAKALRGGNVDLLPNQNFLVCTGNASTIAEIDTNQQVKWSVAIDRQVNPHEQNIVFTLYRAHYSSSLYPCYFTAQNDKEVLSENASSFNLKIFNEGTEDDTYNINVSSPFQSFEKQLTTGLIPKGKSYSLNIKSNRQPVAGETIVVAVKSTTNPGFERNLQVAVK